MGLKFKQKIKKIKGSKFSKLVNFKIVIRKIIHMILKNTFNVVILNSGKSKIHKYLGKILKFQSYFKLS